MAVATKRTQDEIVRRIEERKSHDVLGFERSDYIPRLDYQHAKPYLKEGTTAEEWAQSTADVMDPLEEAKDYMDFAWEKANGERGISASRSISHFIAWVWLSGDDEFASELERMESSDFYPYGKPILRRICEKYGWAETA